MGTSARRLDFEAEPPRAAAVSFSDTTMHLVLVDGRELGVPLAWFPRLAAATAEQRGAFELLDQGVELHWEAIDEDISVPNLLGVPYENS
jgi:hypothetical protein